MWIHKLPLILRGTCATELIVSTFISIRSSCDFVHGTMVTTWKLESTLVQIVFKFRRKGGWRECCDWGGVR